ncbi:hypothetical protein [Candidatus Electronema sp. PJ]|uniref:hypothetical protein n=1 Tax=Candidatus Electronema sp. PJ TaxID=3401572 RepID=UPI003AA7C068
MFEICGRRVKVVTGPKSQTVNICTPDGIHGVYDYIIKFYHPRFVTEAELAHMSFSSIEAVVAFLKNECSGDLEKAPSSPIEKPLAQVPAAGLKPLSNWEITARRVTESAIDQLVEEFVRYPYLHRCEHSIHCRLYELMVANEQLAEKLVFSHWVTQPVQKEWPEFIPRLGKRHGAFDLVVLAPDSVATASLSDFQDGRIRPSLVIEMGLDYPYKHLSNDAQKLRNSGIADSYLIHLTRQHVTDNFHDVESLLLDCGFKSAYVWHRGTTARYKRVSDDSVTEMQV